AGLGARGPKGVASGRLLQALPYDAMGQSAGATAPPRVLGSWKPWVYLLALGALRVLASWTMHRVGVTALSDDDFARTVIAEQFATAPRFDPSQTSWLPFPFWLTGGAMALFGRSVGVAHAVTYLVAIGGTWLLFAGGRC